MNDDVQDPTPVTIQDNIPAGGTAGDDADEDVALLGATAKVGADGRKTVEIPLDTLIGLRKGNRELKTKVRDLEPIAARSNEIEARLNEAQPIIGAILNNPHLRAEAMRAAGGTHKTPEAREQPQDDDAAVAMAESIGLYLNDGVTPDAARGRRVLDTVRSTAKQVSDESVRPFAGLALNQQAEQNLTRAMAMRDDAGTPLATPESIRETAKMLPPHLLANPQVVELVINNAIGLDRRSGRTPRTVDEPLYMDSNNGRGGREPVISQQERGLLTKYGISEKDYAASTRKLETAVANRRGIDME